MYNSVACKIHLEAKLTNHFQALIQPVESLLKLLLLLAQLLQDTKGNIMDSLLFKGWSG